MPQRTGIHLNPRKLIVRMPDIRRAESGKLPHHLIFRKKTLPGQHRIISLHRMPLAHNKTIPVSRLLILRTDIHFLKIKRHQNIHDAHIPADMSALSLHHHIHHILTQLIGQCRQFFHLIHAHSPLKPFIKLLPDKKLPLLPPDCHHKDPPSHPYTCTPHTAPAPHLHGYPHNDEYKAPQQAWLPDASGS